jgi:GNAT superfamily N-acetyltransferase
MKKYSVLKICLLSYAFHIGASSYKLQLFQGPEANKLAPLLAEYRVTYFAEYPNFYGASLEEELPYSNVFFQRPDSAIIIAYYNNQPIGLITGASCIGVDEGYKDSTSSFDAHINLSDYYYIGDVIMLPEYRNKGVGRNLFAMIEEHARKRGYTKTCLISESYEEHPLKPAAYLEYDVVWKKFGYNRMHAFMNARWTTLQVDGSCKTQEHTLEYWYKNL